MILLTHFSTSGKTKYFSVQLPDGFIVETRSKKAALAYIRHHTQTQDETNQKASQKVSVQLGITSLDSQSDHRDGRDNQNSGTSENLPSSTIPETARDSLELTTVKRQELQPASLTGRQKGQIRNSKLPECIQKVLGDLRCSTESIVRESENTTRAIIENSRDATGAIIENSRAIVEESRTIANIARIAIRAASSLVGTDVGSIDGRTERTIHEIDDLRLNPVTIDVTPI